MNKHAVRPLAAALALGAALWLSVSWVSGALTSAAPRGRPFLGQKGPWNACGVLGPRRPGDIVNILGTENALPTGEAIEIFSVPEDRWLILTDFNFLGAVDLLVEILRGEETIKAGPSFSSHVGSAFRPGSVVALRRHPPGDPQFATWLGFGYLVPADEAAEE